MGIFKEWGTQGWVYLKWGDLKRGISKEGGT